MCCEGEGWQRKSGIKCCTAESLAGGPATQDSKATAQPLQDAGSPPARLAAQQPATAGCERGSPGQRLRSGAWQLHGTDCGCWRALRFPPAASPIVRPGERPALQAVHLKGLCVLLAWHWHDTRPADSCRSTFQGQHAAGLTLG